MTASEDDHNEELGTDEHRQRADRHVDLVVGVTVTT
jgi:hypothetical protein